MSVSSPRPYFPRLLNMDPASADGLASSIMAFIDFSWKLVQGSYQVYNSATGLQKRTPISAQ